MKRSARLYNCARCHRQTTLCSHCDRGNIYCSKACSSAARKESLRRAGRTYQNSRKGRFTHAARQRAYRARLQKVTHQGSEPIPRDDPLERPSEKVESGVEEIRKRSSEIRCHFCGALCDDFLRLDFLNRCPSRPFSEKVQPTRADSGPSPCERAHL